MLETARLRYALDFLVALAHHDPVEPLSLREVAQTSEASEKYLEAITGDLRRGAIVVSKRGKGGGYFLGRPADAITLLEVVQACEPELVMVDSPPEFSGVDILWREITERVAALLGEYRLSDLVDGRFSRKQILHYAI